MPDIDSNARVGSPLPPVSEGVETNTKQKIGQRAMNLFKRKSSDKSVQQTQTKSLPYQPRIKTTGTNAQSPPSGSRSRPELEDRSVATATGSNEENPATPLASGSHGPNGHEFASSVRSDSRTSAIPLPLDLADVETRSSESPLIATPTNSKPLLKGRQSESIDSPATPRPRHQVRNSEPNLSEIQQASSRPQVTIASQDQNQSPHRQRHHFRHQLLSHRPRIPHPSRKSSVDIDRTVAAGHIDAAAAVNLAAGASFPVAPSYHERAHPDLQPPKIAFSMLDGPASHDEPVQVETLPPPRLQRPAIKVKIITWNMGGASLPKGDLEVLLGRVGGYIPPEKDWDISEEGDPDSEGALGLDPGESAASAKGKGVSGQEETPRHDRIPPLPHDDGHPYHLLVVAGQECPWGDGKRIATSLGVAGELGDLARSKSKAVPSKGKEKAKEGDVLLSSMPQTPGGIALDALPLNSASLPASSTGEFPFGSPPSIAATTPQIASGSAGHNKGFGGKGWSDMCEDWLCKGPAAQLKATKGLAATTQALVDGNLGSLSEPKDESETLTPTTGSRAASPMPEDPDQSLTATPVGSPPKLPPIAGRRGSATPSLTLPALPSFGRSSSSGAITSTKNSQAVSTDGRQDTKRQDPMSSPSPLPSPSAPLVRDFAAAPAPSLTASASVGTAIKSQANQKQPLQVSIPGHMRELDGTPHALGAYELLVKERCAMIYMAVYCWRGCRDRVRGFDKSHVKSGLLAGRVGNKGAVGVSVKLGQTRLLFVNSHLAAHEGKIQTRLDNVAKIKKELRLDTFLDESDPTNKAEDVTEMFDHSFWCGDLNFRVDITRQHADWLIMNKRYDQALEFDQLRKVMKEGREFLHFNEHEILFPPTYKFDVLKTLKKPKREKTVRRILHRRGHNATALVAPNPTADELDDAEDDAGFSITTPDGSRSKPPSIIETHDEDDEDEEDEDGDSSSVSSTAWESHGSSGFTGPTTDSEDELRTASSFSSPLDPIVSNNTSAASGPQIFSHGNAIKAKWRIMDFVRAATGSHKDSDGPPTPSKKSPKRRSKDTNSMTGSVTSPTSNKSPSKRRSQQQQKTQQPSSNFGSRSSQIETPDTTTVEDATQGSDTLSRRMSSRAAASAPSLGDLVDGVNSEAAPSSIERQSSQASFGSVVAPLLQTSDLQSPGPAPDTFSPGESTVALNSLTTSSPRKASSPKPRRRRSSAGDIERSMIKTEQVEGPKQAEAEGEKQLYDTSAKQRVPSWTDRILWRSNVQRQPDPLPPIEEHEGLSARLGKSLANARKAANATRHLPASAHSDHSAGSPRALPARSQTMSHPISLDDRLHAVLDPQRQSSPNINPASSSLLRSESPMGTTPHAPRSADAVIRVEPPQSNGGSPSSGSSPLRRRPQRTFSDNHASVSERPAVRRGTSSPRFAPVRTSSQPSTPTEIDTASGSIEPRSRTTLRKTSAMLHRPDRDVSPSGGGRRLSSWWSSHFPALLTAQGAAAAFASLTSSGKNAEEAIQIVAPEIVGPKKGEVQCLLYKSLDDREMRALEGKSDHRPVMWVGSVGI